MYSEYVVENGDMMDICKFELEILSLNSFNTLHTVERVRLLTFFLDTKYMLGNRDRWSRLKVYPADT